MSRRTAAAAALPLVLLFALTGCFPVPGTGTDGTGDDTGTTGGDTGGDTDGDALGPVLTACVNGDWTADLDDLASQLGAFMAANGLNVVSSTGSGSQTLSIGGEGVLGFSNEMTFVITIDMSGGLTMTTTQAHTGRVGADWAWDGGSDASDTAGTMVFSEFDDSAYTIDTTVAINGEASDMPVTSPPMAAGNVPLAVTCEGDTMTTHPSGSPFTTTWHRD
ncbi:hypothetical protein [Protaetiibacter intestinalis]|uniref:Uncharacterized protein n=1 Tax=Protaetiibacter intestinalis TaxID=2419774 RepID=A0A387B0P9_9MICO|nr:hypothetical protein [Protaetiibacter intestinalis]AYF97062.1 hypothetical protein D7I47_01555 [Protaetiibacter intestinalis]